MFIFFIFFRNIRAGEGIRMRYFFFHLPLLVKTDYVTFLHMNSVLTRFHIDQNKILPGKQPYVAISFASCTQRDCVLMAEVILPAFTYFASRYIFFFKTGHPY